MLRKLFAATAAVSLLLFLVVAGLRLLDTRLGLWLRTSPVFTFDRHDGGFATVACRGGSLGFVVGHLTPGARLPAYVEDLGVVSERRGNDWVWGCSIPAWLLLLVLIMLPTAWVLTRLRSQPVQARRGFEV